MPISDFISLGFHPIIAQWFKNRFAAPSPPQKNGWPSIAAGNHTLILAPTGSGKPLAAFLWSIDQLFR
jgi:ATP-dependent Lhr-like helicase